MLAYKELIRKYLDLASQATKPEENSRYPESIRSSGDARALYDNCGDNEHLALQLYQAVLHARQDGFRNNPVKKQDQARTQPDYQRRKRSREKLSDRGGVRGVLMQVYIGDIPAEIIKKKIKNLHLAVLPPDGRVRISAPETLSDDAIVLFAKTRIGWIRK